MELGIFLFVALVAGFIIAGQGRKRVRGKYSRKDVPWYLRAAYQQDTSNGSESNFDDTNQQ